MHSKWKILKGEKAREKKEKYRLPTVAN